MKNEKTAKKPLTTGTLTNALLNTSEEKLDDFYRQHADDLLPEEKPFASALCRQIESSGLSRNQVFLRAGVSQSAGYKYTDGERVPEDRDTVLRLCLALHCDIRQTDRLLKAAGKEPLYARSRRDGVLLRAIASQQWDIETLDRQLLRLGLSRLTPEETLFNPSDRTRK